MNKMILKRCKLVDQDYLVDILIEDGKIVKIGDDLTQEDAKVIDVEGKIVMPGLIDPHVHFREPGLTHKEDLYSGSCAAVAGGVTTFIDMPNNNPAIITSELMDKKKELAKKCIANYGFHMGTSPETDVEEVKKAAANNTASTKVFLNASTGNLFIEDEILLEKIFENSKMITTHAEDPEKVNLAIRLGEKTKIPVYLCHISQKSEIEAIKNGGYDKVYAEVSPHHLFLTEKDRSQFNIMKPELRTEDDQAALWKAIGEGIVDTVGTDHAPHLKSEKLEKTTYGVTGIESMLPLLLDAYNKGRITLKKIQELCCENPSKIFKIKNKGSIKEGYDADIVVIDLDKEKTVKNEELFTKAGWTPYDGWTLKGWPIKTIVNGNVVFDNGQINDESKGKEVIFENDQI